MEEEKDLEQQVKKDRRPVVIGVAAAAAAVLAVGGVCGYRAYDGHRMSVAREACQSAVADLGKTAKAYKALLGADDTVAALKTDVKSVRDARTIDALKKAAEPQAPAMVECDASDRTGLDEATARADKAATAVKADAKTLKAAVKAVESSKLDKTVADADALYKATDGKVQDAKTREALAKAVKARDAEAIAKAVKAVNDSKAAKEKADAEAKAKAEREASEQAAAQQAAGSTGGSYSDGSYSTGSGTRSGGSGSYGTQRSYGQSNATQAPQQSQRQSTTQAPQQNQQQSGGACPNGAVCGVKPNMNSHSTLECTLPNGVGSCSGGSNETYYW